MTETLTTHRPEANPDDAGLTPPLERTEYRRDLAWQIFAARSGNNDPKRFQKAYIGYYANRGAFGDSLLEEMFDAQQVLSVVPQWLRPYVRLDGAAVATDFEREGNFHVIDVDEVGTFVFDAVAVDFDAVVKI